MGLEVGHILSSYSTTLLCKCATDSLKTTVGWRWSTFGSATILFSRTLSHKSLFCCETSSTTREGQLWPGWKPQSCHVGNGRVVPPQWEKAVRMLRSHPRWKLHLPRIFWELSTLPTVEPRLFSSIVVRETERTSSRGFSIPLVWNLWRETRRCHIC